MAPQDRGPFLDSRLRDVSRVIKDGVALPTLVVPRGDISMARVRELESLGGFAFFASALSDTIGLDIPNTAFDRFLDPTFVKELWYDAPHFALQDQPPPEERPVFALDEAERRRGRETPFRSSEGEVQQRLQERQQLAEATPESIFAFTGMQGPEELDEGQTIVKSLKEQRDFVGSTLLDEEHGLDGSDATVAVLDTGIDAGHPMLNGQVEDAFSMVPEDPGTDRGGHGSWVASSVAGKRFEVPRGPWEGRVLEGMAPGASLIDVKVLTGEGSGFLSDTIAGIEKAVEAGADLINMSLGSPNTTPREDPAERAVNNAFLMDGVPSVVASGNSWGWGTVGSPGTARNAITVGSVAMETPDPGVVSTFSSKGPTPNGRIQPDVAAAGGQAGTPPGDTLNEVILGAASGFVKETSGQGLVSPLRGTSMAAPSVAGLLAQVHELGLPTDREALFGVLSRGTRETGVFPFKNNRKGWGILDGENLLDAMEQGVGAARQAIVTRQLDANRPTTGTLANVAVNVQPLPVSNPNETRISLV